jgi:hypothetical protein
MFVPNSFPAPCSHTVALIETCCWKITVVGSGFSCSWFEAFGGKAFFPVLGTWAERSYNSRFNQKANDAFFTTIQTFRCRPFTFPHRTLGPDTSNKIQWIQVERVPASIGTYKLNWLRESTPRLPKPCMAWVINLQLLVQGWPLPSHGKWWKGVETLLHFRAFVPAWETAAFCHAALLSCLYALESIDYIKHSNTCSWLIEGVFGKHICNWTCYKASPCI